MGIFVDVAKRTPKRRGGRDIRRKWRGVRIEAEDVLGRDACDPGRLGRRDRPRVGAKVGGKLSHRARTAAAPGVERRITTPLYFVLYFVLLVALAPARRSA
jgi:hypothetical protein